MTHPSPSGIAAYGRLSRDDEKDKSTPLEAKIALRQAVLITLARHAADIVLTPEQITFELKSGGSLDDRPGLLALLEQCADGQVHTLIIFDVDRLTRDVGDWKRIERALYKGRIRLITSRGEYHFTPQFDSTLLQILAVLGEKERRSFSYRKKAVNAQSAREGKRTLGYATYGYHWDTQTKRYYIVDDEYEIVTYIFGRIWDVGCHTIARELNTRGVTPPGVGKRAVAAVKWLPGTIGNMIRNPFYGGRPAKRTEVDREGELTLLPPAQWIWAEADEIRYLLPPDPNHPDAPLLYETLPHPITFAQWATLQELLPTRAQGRVPTKGLLTGLLRCAQGRNMHMRRPHYHCVCPEHGETHRGHHIKQPPLDALIIALVVEILDNLPLAALVTPPAPDTADALAADITRLKRQYREKEATVADLVNRAGFYQSLPTIGVAGHTASLNALTVEVQAIQTRLAELESRRVQPSLRLAAPLLAKVRERGGGTQFFAEAPLDAQRLIIQTLVRVIKLQTVESGKGMTRGVEVVLYPQKDGQSEETRILPIIHPAKGTIRGPYLWRKKTIGEA